LHIERERERIDIGTGEVWIMVTRGVVIGGHSLLLCDHGGQEMGESEVDHPYAVHRESIWIGEGMICGMAEEVRGRIFIRFGLPPICMILIPGHGVKRLVSFLIPLIEHFVINIRS